MSRGLGDVYKRQPLFSGGTSSGESQIRRWLLENDLIEAIIALPVDLFYNTGIATYIWVLSKNKREERRGKIQLIDAGSIFHKLRKALGNKKNEISPEDRSAITKLYADFAENELCKIYPNTEFIYREYTVMQPLQRSYAVTEERIRAMLSKGSLSSLYDPAKVAELENSEEELTGKELKKLENYQNNAHVYEAIIELLRCADDDKVYLSPAEFLPVLTKILSTAKVSYVKWDMNRSITECYSAVLPADRQGEVFHRYILGVYDLYERLTSTFPHVLFESCASGGGRFDPGILYYAPQGWTSDDTDAIERVKIQYGTSMCYPISSMGSHVSVVPNHQTRRETPLKTRANAAYFGTFGYELDLNKLTAEEIEEVKKQVKFMKAYREVIQYGTFYRLASPFDDEECGWMVVSDDKKTAIVAWFRTLYTPNKCFTRMKLHGLDPDAIYSCNVLGGQALTVSKTPDGKLIYEKVSGDKGEDSAVNVIAGPSCYGDELMNLGLITSDTSAGEIVGEDMPCGDYDSRLYVLKAE